MSRISDPLIAEGLATKSETRRILTELNRVATDCETVISLPRIFQVWGKRASKITRVSPVIPGRSARALCADESPRAARNRDCYC